MEMMDSGKLQGGDGKTYHLGKSLIILTTNKGDERIYPRGMGKALTRDQLEKRLSTLSDKDIKSFFMEGEVNQQLPPAILERIDRAVPAGPPSQEGALTVARQEADRITKNIQSDLGYKVNVSDSLLKHIVDSVYVPEDGVRSIVRSVKAAINQGLSQAHKALQVPAKAEFELTYKDGSTQYEVSYQGHVSPFAATEPARKSNVSLDPSKPEEYFKKLADLKTTLRDKVVDQNRRHRCHGRSLEPN